MGKIKILAGDYPKPGDHQFLFGNFHLQPADSWGWKKDTYAGSDVEELSEANERAGVSVFGAAGWGTVGAVIAGPAGLLAGAILGGRGKKVVFVAKFKNGKKIMGETDGKTWSKMLAANF